jgi:glycosyltransferase involved in cell wall biosynthesis
MKIGMILESEFPPDPRVENEAFSLIESGKNVSLLCLSFSKNNREEKVKGIEVNRYYLKKQYFNKFRVAILDFPLYNMMWAKQLKKFIKNTNPDILHVHDLPLLGIVLKVGKKLNLPVVVDLHENYPEALKTYSYTKTLLGRFLIRIPQWKKYERKVLPQCQAVVVLSEESKQRIASMGIPENRIIITPNTVTLDNFLSFPINKKIVQKYKDYFIFSYVGDLGANRGIQYVISALADVLKVEPKARLLLVGESWGFDKNELKNQVLENNLEKFVYFTGWQEFSLFPTYLAASDVCLLPIPRNPQTESGVSNKFFQYMAMGKPMIVSDCKPQKKIAEEENCGLVYKYDDTNDLAACMIKLLKDKKLRDMLASNSKKAAKEKYNWTITGKSLIDFYAHLNK